MIEINANTIGFGTVEITVPAETAKEASRILLTEEETLLTKVFYTDGWRDCKNASWIKITRRYANSRRIMYQCSHCGYKTRTRSRFCGGCGNHMTIRGVTNGKKKKK